MTSDREPMPIEMLPELGEAKIVALRRAAAKRRLKERSELAARRGVTRAEKSGFVTLDQACAILGVGATSVRKWARRNGVRRELDKGWYDREAVQQEAARRAQKAPLPAAEPLVETTPAGLPEAWETS